MKTIAKRIFGLLAVASLVFIHGCKDEVDPIPTPTEGNRVLVSNEGIFQQGNASLGVYNSEKNEYTDKRFKAVNGIPMGDVLNSIYLINGEYWCVVNNSGLIHVIDSASLTLKHTITGFLSPRHVCRVDNQKVYVTDLFSGVVSIVSTSTYKVTGTIPMEGWTEHALLAGDGVYITNPGKPYVFLINPATDQVVDSLKIGNGANSMLRANNATVLILCEGKYGSSELAALYRIDPKARQIVGMNAFPDKEKPHHLRQSPLNQKVFLINNGIVALSDVDFEVESSLVALTGAIYAFDIDHEGNFYVGDAKDFAQNSDITIYHNATYQVKNKFVAGLNTNGFIFE